MTLNHRLLLEALCRLGRATTYALADEAGITRRQAKGAVTALLGQRFILCKIPCTPVGRGRAPAVYEWSGKLFPASSEISKPVEVERVDIGLIVASINAMAHAGRAA